MGNVISEVTQVWFEVYNNGSQPAMVSIVDRVDSINASTLNMLYGTPEPDELKIFGNLTRILWENVRINASSSIKYQYLAESWRKIPVIFNETLLVNGKPANITQTKNLYMVKANVSDTVTFQITLQNTIQKLYTSRGTVTPPVMCVVTATLSSDYFSGLKTSPETNSTSIVAGKSIMTWLIFLDETPRTFTISGKVVKTGPWGDVPVDPISIQITPASIALKQQLEKSIDGLDASIIMLENFTEASYGLSDALYQMYKAVEGIVNATSGLVEADAGLVIALNAIAQGLYANCLLINSSKNFILTAVQQLTLFMNEPRMVAFLASNQDLAMYLSYVMTNMTVASMMMDDIRNGLYELYDTTLRLSEMFNSTTAGLDEVVQNVQSLADGIRSISNTTRKAGDEMKEPLERLREERAKLEDLMLTFHYKGMTPYDIEVLSPEYQGAYEMRVSVKPVNGNLWAVTNMDVTNPKNFTQMVYGVAVRLKTGQTLLQPSHVEVYVNGTWQTFSVTDVRQVGMIYDAATVALYFWPRLKVNATVTENVLVD
ncbi:MAG: hypothetical protein QW231_00005, partial [Candidatus Bathyarchaeia archaeon]